MSALQVGHCRKKGRREDESDEREEVAERKEGREKAATHEFLPPLQPPVDLVLVEDVSAREDPNDFSLLEVFEADGALRGRNEKARKVSEKRSTRPRFEDSIDLERRE